MAKRIPCGGENAWSQVSLGDCGQHLKTGESPVIKSMGITYGGGMYKNPPIALISGMDTNGFYGYGVLNNGGFVSRLEIISSGWHMTHSPIIVFSGEFSEKDKNCFGKPWDDKKCMCSGTGNILGIPIYKNITLIPPQCSPLLQEDWVGNGSIRTCSTNDLAKISIDKYGRCNENAPRCLTSIESGWPHCANNSYGKTANRCFTKGDRIPELLCSGPWYLSGVIDCNNIIPQSWEKTDEFLDVGVCKKRGHKEVLGMKSWHGQVPLDICGAGAGTKEHDGDCSYGERAYSQKYLTSDGIYSYSMSYSDVGESHPRDGRLNQTVAINATVGRTDGKVTVNENVYYDGKNWSDFYQSSPGFGGYSACSGVCIGSLEQDGVITSGIVDCTSSCYGYPATGWNSYPWNYIENNYQDLYGSLGYSRKKVSTRVSASSNSYTFTQEITDINFYQSTQRDEFGNITGYYKNHDYKFHSLETITVELSNPYTVEQLNSDWEILVNQWNLLDDIQYPWKYDFDYQSIPKVTFCENGPTSPYGLSEVLKPTCPNIGCNFSYSTDYGSIAWNDCEKRPDYPVPPASYSGKDRISMITHCSWGGIYYIGGNYNGKIIGGPSQNGHLNTIDFSHLNYRDQCCSCRCETINSLLLDSYGAVSNSYHVTQWPNLMEAQNLYFGAFKAINDYYPQRTDCRGSGVAYVGTDIFMGAKYAEIIQLDKPSLNSGMPCGIGSSLERVLQNDSDSELNSFVTNTYKTNCEQTGYMSNNGHCMGCNQQSFDKLRWKYLSGQSYACGNIATVVSGMSDGVNLRIVLNANYTGTSGEYINTILNIEGFDYSGAYKITEKNSLSGLTITGSFIPSTNVIGWVDFPDINDIYDNYPKGDFIIRKWDTPTMAGSSDSFYQYSIPSYSHHCISYKTCDPSIVVIAPSDGIEAQNNTRGAVIVGMPALTPRPCGAKYNYIPQQWMTDPTWNKPSKPCCLVSGFDRPECAGDNDYTNQNHTWEEDNGSCVINALEYTENGLINHHYYPSRPYVEAVPTQLQLPTPPAGQNNCNISNNILLTVGKCYNNTELAGLSSTQIKALEYFYGGKFCPLCEPPNKAELYWDKYAPWIIAENQENCIKNS